MLIADLSRELPRPLGINTSAPQRIVSGPGPCPGWRDAV